MELKLYSESLTSESLTPDGHEIELRYIELSDFLQEVQGLIVHVWSLGGRVIYYNSYGGYHAIVK